MGKTWKFAHSNDWRQHACFASNCDIKEAGTDTFMLRDLQAKTIHVVFPSESDVIEVDRKESRTGIVLHNRNTNSYISVTDRTESPEEIIQRFHCTLAFCNEYRVPTLFALFAKRWGTTDSTYPLLISQPVFLW